MCPTIAGTKTARADVYFSGASREKGSHDAACLTVSIYDAIATRKELIELTIYFRRVWTALTVGGDLTRYARSPSTLRSDC